MKPDFNKRYTSIAVHAGAVLLLVIFAVFAFLHLDAVWNVIAGIVSVLSPILIGAILAYVFSPIVGFFEKHVYHRLDLKKKYRLKRVLSVVSMFVLVILFLLLLVMKVIPAVLRGYEDLAIMSDLYLETLKEWLLETQFGGSQMLAGYFDTFVGYIIDLIDQIYGALFELTPDVASLASAIFAVLGDVVLGVVLSIYFLFSKEKIMAQFKKMVRAFLSRRKFGELERSVHVTNEKFGGFLKGQVADALIIGSFSYISLSLIGIPYYPLVSVLVGISALIPVFGFLIGTLIGAVIILLADPLDVIWFALFMVVLYFVNKKMIRPRLVRVTVDASSVFMLAAIIITTGLVGFWGLIIGVPIFAVAYAFLHSLINKRLGKRGLATDAYAYYATKAGKELYLEREFQKTRRRRGRGKGEENEIFSLHDDEIEEDGELFASSADSAKTSSEHEFPQ